MTTTGQRMIQFMKNINESARPGSNLDVRIKYRIELPAKDTEEFVSKCHTFVEVNDRHIDYPIDAGTIYGHLLETEDRSEEFYRAITALLAHEFRDKFDILFEIIDKIITQEGLES